MILKQFIIDIGPLGIIWLVGILLVVFGICILGVLIPVKDRVINEKEKEIGELEHKRDVLLGDNWQDYQNYATKEKIIRLTYEYLKNTGASQEDKKSCYDEYIEARRESIGKLYIISTGKIPFKEQFEKWANMSMAQLLEEDKKLRPTAEKNIKELLNKIKLEKYLLIKLNKDKTNIIVIATIIQVIGLVLINTAAFFKKR